MQRHGCLAGGWPGNGVGRRHRREQPGPLRVEVCDALHQIAKRFDNGDGEPVYFGSHRRAQGVIVPVDVWEKLLEQAEDELDLASARQRLANDDGSRLTRSDLDEAFRGAAEAASRKPA